MLKNLQKYFFCLILAVFFVQPGGSMGAPQRSIEPVALKVVIFPYLSSAPFFIGLEEGYFAEQGLQIDTLKLNEDVAIQALATGQADVWGGLISTGALNAMYRGAHIRIVADKGFFAPDGCPFFGLVARKALVEAGKLNRPDHLKGRKVAWYPASFEEYFLEKALQKGGLKLDDVQKIHIPPPADLGAMAKGTLDLTVTVEPWVTRLAQAGHGVLWMPVQDVIPGFQFSYIMYGPNILEKNPDAGRRFMVAYLKAVRQYNQGKTAQNLESLAKYTKLDKALLTKACWAQFHNDGSINVQSVLDFQDWALAKGYLDTKVPVKDFWDPSFIEYGNRALKR